jgi:hypothetical protein
MIGAPQRAMHARPSHSHMDITSIFDKWLNGSVRLQYRLTVCPNIGQ